MHAVKWRTLPTWAALILASLLLAACAGGLPAGQIEGTLTANGEPLAGQQMFISLTEIPPGGARMIPTTTDENGHFIFRNMQPGEYLIMVGFSYVLQNGALYTFLLPEGEGIDLGTVDASLLGAP